jgi:hypothetical protein
VSTAYQRWHVRLLDALFQQTGDSFWKSTADRWRDYTPPPGLSSSPILPSEVR